MLKFKKNKLKNKTLFNKNEKDITLNKSDNVILDENNKKTDWGYEIFNGILNLIGIVFIVLFIFKGIAFDPNKPNIKSTGSDIPILLDENFIKNIKDECIINDLKKQVDNIIKTGNTDAKLDFNNYKTAKKNCSQEENKEQYKNSNNLEKIKEALDNSKVSN